MKVVVNVVLPEGGGVGDVEVGSNMVWMSLRCFWGFALRLTDEQTDGQSFAFATENVMPCPSRIVYDVV